MFPDYFWERRLTLRRGSGGMAQKVLVGGLKNYHLDNWGNMQEKG
jgi:hypothetical protein